MGVQGSAKVITRPLRVSARGLKVEVDFRGPADGVAVGLLGWSAGGWNQPRLFLPFAAVAGLVVSEREPDLDGFPLESGCALRRRDSAL